MDNNVMFFEMPKTASQAMTKVVKGRCRVLSHGPLARGMTVVSFRKEFPGVFIFTFLRNPFDRVLSAYSCLLKPYWDPLLVAHQKEYIKPYGGFRDFVVRGIGGGHVTRQMHFRPMASWIEDGDGRLCVDWTGRFERLQDDFDGISDRLGWPRTKLPMWNESEHAGYRECYDDEMEAVVARTYERDFELGGYEKRIVR